MNRPSFSSGFKKILSNTGYLFGEKIFNMGLSLVVGIYVARYLGPNDFGLFNYANSLIGLVMAVASLGTTSIVIRDLVVQPEEREGAILGTAFSLMFGAGIITTFMIIGAGFLLNNDAVTRWLIIISSSNLILQAFNAFDYWFQAKILSKYSVYARTAGQIAVSVLKVAFILLSLSVMYFALTIIVAGIVRVIVWVYSYKSQNKSLKNWKFEPEYAKSLLKNTWPLILSGISVAIYMKIDQVMLKSMADAKAVGNYAAAVRVSELWYFIPMTIASSVFPSIIKSKKNSIEKYYQRLQYLYNIMAGMAIVIAIPMTFLSDFVVQQLFGDEYSMAGGVLAVHIWAGIFVFLGVARSNWIINENFQFYGMIFTAAGALSNVLLNIWLIPVLGIMGAAWATVISQAISAWLLAVFFKKTRPAFLMQTKSMLHVIFIYPAIKSIQNIFNETKNN